MSKRQRGFQPSGSAPGANGASGASGSGGSAGGSGGSSTGPGGSTSPVAPTTRSAARRRALAPKAAPADSFFERYRALLLIGFVILGLGIVAVAFIGQASAQPYVCDTLLAPGPTDPIPTPRPATPSPAATPTPSPTPVATPTATPAPGASPTEASPSPAPTPSPSPEPQPTQRLGFATQDLGRSHVAPGETVDYDFCPPTSGNHYNLAGQAPLPRAFYGPGTVLRPQNWVHNLEHGYVVLLYKGEPSQAVLDQIRAVMDGAAPSAFGAANCAPPNKVIAVRFDDMNGAVRRRGLGPRPADVHASTR